MSSLRFALARRVRVRAVWRMALVLALASLVALALAGVVDPLQSGVLTMFPALALAAMMLTRPYLGERAIARLRARRSRRGSAARVNPVRARPVAAHLARGGRLIAVALAGRAPPLALAGQH